MHDIVLYLNVIRLDDEQIKEVSVHPGGLEGPPGPLLVKQGPEDRKRQHHVGNVPQGFNISHKIPATFNKVDYLDVIPFGTGRF